MSEVASQEASAARKERLAKLRQASLVAQGDGEEAPSGVVETKVAVKPKIKFRNYKPQDEKLGASAEVVETPSATASAPKKATNQSEATGDLNEKLVEQGSKGPTWDLKRDLAPLLEKLEKRTQLSLLEIVKESSDSTDKPSKPPAPAEEDEEAVEGDLAAQVRLMEARQEAGDDDDE